MGLRPEGGEGEDWRELALHDNYPTREPAGGQEKHPILKTCRIARSLDLLEAPASDNLPATVGTSNLIFSSFEVCPIPEIDPGR